jgi:hypothetical protein
MHVCSKKVSSWFELKPSGNTTVCRKDRMTRDANSLIRRGLDLLQDVLEVVTDVREGAGTTGEYRGAPPGRVVRSIKGHKTGDEDLSALSTEELHIRLVAALAEVGDIGEELAQRAEHGARVVSSSSAEYANRNQAQD